MKHTFILEKYKINIFFKFMFKLLIISIFSVLQAKDNLKESNVLPVLPPASPYRRPYLGLGNPYVDPLYLKGNQKDDDVKY